MEGVDRTIRWRGDRPPVVAIAREGRPLAAVQSDVIEAVVVANSLDERRADRFRRAAWNVLDDAAPVEPVPPRRRSALQPAEPAGPSGVEQVEAEEPAAS